MGLVARIRVPRFVGSLALRGVRGSRDTRPTAAVLDRVSAPKRPTPLPPFDVNAGVSASRGTCVGLRQFRGLSSPLPLAAKSSPGLFVVGKARLRSSSPPPHILGFRLAYSPSLAATSRNTVHQAFL